MIIIGLNVHHADASACIFVDGRLVAAAEEERFTRIKHRGGFPSNALRYCLSEAGTDLQSVDHICVGRDTTAKQREKLLYAMVHPKSALRALSSRFQNRSQVRSVAIQISDAFDTGASQLEPKMVYVEHHRSHLASSFFCSPYDEAACLSIDGSGDFTTTMRGFGKANHITIFDSLDFPHSLGIFYTAFTQFLGFPNYGDEYKVMGMAPYGTPQFVPDIRKIIRPTSNGFFKLDKSFFAFGDADIITYNRNLQPVVGRLFSKKFFSLFGQNRHIDEPITQVHKDLAASVQKAAEEIIFHLAERLYQKTKCPNLCLSGGVAQNSVANGKLLDATSFRHIYIPPAAHDAGISMGAALYQQHQVLDIPRRQILSAYTGSSFTQDEIAKCLLEKEMPYQTYPDDELFARVVECLVQGGVVGWFTGRAEFGPRALGHRSILADPRNPDAKEILNLKIKRRENFRPFAPSILAEESASYFERGDAVPFMEKVFKIKSEKRQSIPAVTHVDGTGRLQTVDKNVSPRYHALISAFKERTGIPILLNTSFNENEPIVQKPEDAINCFLRTDMDMLVLENMVVTRNQALNNGMSTTIADGLSFKHYPD